MRRVPLDTAIKMLKNHETAGNGKIFSCRWIKKDGTVASRTLRFNVKKDIKGVGLKFDPSSRNLLGAWDMTGHRVFINLPKVLDFTISGTSFEIIENSVLTH